MNTPLRDEIAGRIYDLLSELGVKMDSCDMTVGAEEEADHILNLIDSKMPEKLEVDSENHNHMTEAQYQFIVGRNEALTEVKSILKGETE